MRIAMVSEHASPLAALGGVDAGGQNVYVASLATELGRRGMDVVVYTRRDDARLPARVKMSPRVVVEHVEAGPPRQISKDLLLPFMDEFADKLSDAWRLDAPAVVHSHFWMSGRAAIAAAHPLGIPVVHTFHALGVVKRRHQGDKDTSPPERLAEEEAIVAKADRIVSTCSDEVFELVRMGADLKKVSVVPCGVDVELFCPEGPAEPRTPGLHRLVVLSRLVERKGIGNVITALHDVPGAELVIAGGPDARHLSRDPEAIRLRALADVLGLTDRVSLRGRLERCDVPSLLRSADLVVSVPWYEPFGIVPVEAMACGTPVVATAVGGMIDTVVHGRTGVHVPPRRPDILAIAINELLADPARRNALGAAGAERARTRYSWQRVAASTLEVYSDLASGGARSAAEEASS